MTTPTGDRSALLSEIGLDHQNKAVIGRPPTSPSRSICVEKPHSSSLWASSSRMTHCFSARSAAKADRVTSS